jgi:RNA polymerase sigma factor (sigma-70 family)
VNLRGWRGEKRLENLVLNCNWADLSLSFCHLMDDSPANSKANTAADPGGSNRENNAFATTLWSVVLDARDRDLDKAAAALHQLCGIYWYPIYAYIRRRGSNFHEAEDLTQGFFEHLLEGELLKNVKQDKRKFRSFLLTALNHFLSNEWDKRRSLKRGGQRLIISLDEVTAEGLFGSEPAGDLTPEKLFDREWASMLIEKVFAQLREEYKSPHNERLLARFEPFLTQEVTPGVYAQLSTELGMNQGAAKVALHRLRRRFGELLRREVETTLSDMADIDEEVRYLLSAISE